MYHQVPESIGFLPTHTSHPNTSASSMLPRALSKRPYPEHLVAESDCQIHAKTAPASQISDSMSTVSVPAKKKAKIEHSEVSTRCDVPGRVHSKVNENWGRSGMFKGTYLHDNALIHRFEVKPLCVYSGRPGCAYHVRITCRVNRSPSCYCERRNSHRREHHCRTITSNASINCSD